MAALLRNRHRVPDLSPDPTRRYRSAPHTRVAVIDIGSNSIRLVVFQGPGPHAGRAPITVFNEKVLCGLGRGLGESGRLNPDGLEMAHANLRRFKQLAERMGASRIEALATAAVREASDGPQFVADVAARTGITIRILDGSDEARLSAAGVLAAIPDAHGVIGDLGGGSLELVEVGPDGSAGHVTLPLGPLRQSEELLDDLKRGRLVIDHALGSVPWLTPRPGCSFYAVGGAWRTLARLMMEDQRYPLHVIHHYTASAERVVNFLRRFRKIERDELKRRALRSKRRLDILPWASLVLERLLLRLGASHLVFSATGLREGCLYEQLDAGTRHQDPLLAAAETVAADGRFPLGADELFAFIQPLLDGASSDRLRLAHAACLLSDIGWREHPDYRPQHAYLRVLRLPFTAIDHQERAWLATALAARYGAAEEDLPDRTAALLLDPQRLAEAQAVGLALRLGYTLSGGAPGVLPDIRLEPVDQFLMLTLPDSEAEAMGDAVMRRFDALARHLGLIARQVEIDSDYVS